LSFGVWRWAGGGALGEGTDSRSMESCHDTWFKIYMVVVSVTVDVMSGSRCIVVVAVRVLCRTREQARRVEIAVVTLLTWSHLSRRLR
jgi:hypothetical protein